MLARCRGLVFLLEQICRCNVNVEPCVVISLVVGNAILPRNTGVVVVLLSAVVVLERCRGLVFLWVQICHCNVNVDPCVVISLVLWLLAMRFCFGTCGWR